jgi:ribosomal protein S18 acetylase RimI-like enzyme
MESDKIVIKPAISENLFDIEICAKEFIDLIENFKENFLNGDFLVLNAYYDSILAGVLVAERNIRQIDSLEKIIPNLNLKLIYINKKFRNNHIGKKLLDSFIKIQKQNEIASIFIELPQKYQKGINFLKKHNFQQVEKIQNNIILELNLWNDYGIVDCQTIEEDLNDMLS